MKETRICPNCNAEGDKHFETFQRAVGIEEKYLNSDFFKEKYLELKEGKISLIKFAEEISSAVREQKK